MLIFLLNRSADGGKIQRTTWFPALELSLHRVHWPCGTPREAWSRRTWTPVNTSLPVAQTAENHGGNDTEGEDVQHIGQQHLPLLVQAILALLVTDSSQHRNWAWKAGFRTVGHHTAEGGRASPNWTWGLSGLSDKDWLGLPSHAKRGPANHRAINIPHPRNLYSTWITIWLQICFLLPTVEGGVSSIWEHTCKKGAQMCDVKHFVLFCIRSWHRTSGN